MSFWQVPQWTYRALRLASWSFGEGGGQERGEEGGGGATKTLTATVSSMAIRELRKVCQAYLEVRLRPQGGICPGGGERPVHILEGIEVQAEGRQIGAQRQGRQIWICHADDAEKAQEPKAIR